ncbi:MFS transporter [Brytella acorum]|uniref:MFS transporter n=1 Tax=Brytella acorum TaxID=2959299 RepID=A0AA35VB72_9PROT|nr:MFS transporter [Brytella acorum]MDF3624894.1 MFS transporter [Brytella acorum]CAI9120199.1 MFS transporter [Brytella acorum]
MQDETRQAPPPGPQASSLTILLPYWRVTLAAFLGWFLDAFDQVALLLCLPDMGHSFGVDLEAMGVVVTAQSIGRAFGNTGWGWLADRYGRRLTFMLGIIWFAAFSGATAVAWSYVMLVVIQFLFGIGFGGEWTASAALLMESVPARARSLASALMMSGYEVGFFVAAGAQAIILPHYGWRAMFLLGILPAILAIFIRIGVPESPVWLKMRRSPEARMARVSGGMFRLDGAAIQAIAFMAVLQFQNAALYAFYPTLLRTEHHLTPGQLFPMIAAYCVGSLMGKPICGALAARFGDRRVLLGYLVLTLVVFVPFVRAASPMLMVVTAFAVGGVGAAVWAVVPHFLSQRFPSATRSFGMGTSYAAAAGGQALSGLVIPWLALRLDLGTAMIASVFAGTAVVAAILLYRPSTLPGLHMEGEVTE